MLSCCWGCLYFHLLLAAQIIEKGLQIFPPSFLPFFPQVPRCFFFFCTFSHPVFPVSGLVCVTRLVCMAQAPQHLTADSHREREEERRRGRKEGRMWREGERKSGNANERTCQRRGRVNESRRRVWKRGEPRRAKWKTGRSERRKRRRDWGRKCSIGGSQGSISLLFLKRGSGGGWKHRERGTTLALHNLRHVRRSGKASWTRWRNRNAL